MSAKLEIPIRKNMALALLNRVRSAEHNNGGGPGGNLMRRRRVFVQTETGCVLGMDLERGDNAHTVKRRLQIALNIPTQESSLSYGDTILKNDLSGVRNDSPLLLTRNVMQRSSSTPCLSPTGNGPLQQRDPSEPIQILGGSRFFGSKELVKDIVAGINSGVDPIPVQSGLGGAYFFGNRGGETVAIVKPTDEEPFAPNNPKGFVGKALGQPGLKRSVRVGETGFREVAAYLLDHDHFANVPLTVLVKVTHSIFNINEDGGVKSLRSEKKVSKIASLQKFIAHDFDASDYGTSSFPVSAVHRIGILDVRIFNTDRHAGNLLVRKLDQTGWLGQVELTPIDHGLCLPESLEDPYFEWIHWPQASIPFSEEELEYIRKLDPARDSEMLQRELPMIREACLRVLVLSTVFLKEAAAFGLCLSEIGEMMSREFRVLEDRPSELELLCLEARRSAVDWDVSSTTSLESNTDDEYVFDLDSESAFRYKSKTMNSHATTLSKLDEDLEEERSAECWPSWVSGNHEIRGSLSRGVSSASGIGRADEKLLSVKSFVKLADMGKEEWAMFLDKFKELLLPAFMKRKSSNAEQLGQKLRLGTSCRF